jgi:sulfate adenylyltransferase
VSKIIDSDNSKKALIEPHGGTLVDRCLGDAFQDIDLVNLPKLSVDVDVLMDLEQFGIGTFSPIEGFLKRDDYQNVLDNMRLVSGVPWTIPIILSIDDKQRSILKRREEVAITYRADNEVHGIVEIEDIYPYDKEEFAKKIYGTTSVRHPGRQYLERMGSYLLGGKVKLRRKYDSNCNDYNLTPAQVRDYFSSLGWSKVVGFHTRNVIHRSHEFIQIEAMKRCKCDGLFVHPIIGRKKKGDYTADTIIQSYDVMMKCHYPKNKVAFGVFRSYSRYAGPREAIFTALCRKNFGCSHFIVGRDHTGVGNYYHPTASQEIFRKFDDLGIEPVFFGEIGYSKDLGRYVDVQDFPDNSILKISGTEARHMLKQKIMLPEWFMRPEISRLIIDKLNNNEEVFVQ